MFCTGLTHPTQTLFSSGQLGLLSHPGRAVMGEQQREACVRNSLEGGKDVLKYCFGVFPFMNHLVSSSVLQSQQAHRRDHSTDHCKSLEHLWASVAQGVLAQCRLVKSSVSEMVIPSLAVGASDPVERSSLSVEAAVRRMHTGLRHGTVLDMRRMLQCSEGSTGRHGFAGAVLVCTVRCDHGSRHSPWSGSSADSRSTDIYLAMHAKWLPGWAEDVRVKSVNIVDEATRNTSTFFASGTSEVLLI